MLLDDDGVGNEEVVSEVFVGAGEASTQPDSVCVYFISFPRKLRSKNPKVALNLWQKLLKKLR